MLEVLEIKSERPDRDVQRRDSECIGTRMLSFKLPGRRPKGRPKRRFIDELKRTRTR